MPYDKNKPWPHEWLLDEAFIALPPAVKWTALALHMHSDDQGRETTTIWMLRQAVWPHEPDRPDEEMIDALLELAEIGFLGLYEVEGRSYYQILSHPQPSHPKRSKHPEPPASFRQSAGDPPEDRSAWEREGGERAESAGGESRQQPAGIPPSPFCAFHQPNGTRQNCRHCGTARLAHEQWLLEHRAAGEEIS